MIGQKIFASAATVMSAGAVASTPLTINWGLAGSVPILPLLAGTGAAVIVRAIIVTDNQKRLWLYNVAVAAMTMLLTGAIIADHGLNLSHSVFLGIGLGGLGVGVIELGKAGALSVIRSIASAISEATKGK